MKKKKKRKRSSVRFLLLSAGFYCLTVINQLYNNTHRCSFCTPTSVADVFLFTKKKWGSKPEESLGFWSVEETGG